jgi:FixJ family two-component response regulator
MNVATWNHPSQSFAHGARAPADDQAAVVFVVDDDPNPHRSLEAVIEPTGCVVRTFACAEALLDSSPPVGASCLILVMRRPGGDGVAVQARIARERTATPIVVVAGRADVPTTVQAMKAGAVEFLVKPFEDRVLLNAVEDALECSRAAVAAQTQLQRLQLLYGTLSVREKQVMALVVAGFLNKQIAFELGISEVTVKAHRGHVMEKMQVRSLAGLVRMSASLGLP